MINVARSVGHTQNVKVREKVVKALYAKYNVEKVIEPTEQL